MDALMITLFGFFMCAAFKLGKDSNTQEISNVKRKFVKKIEKKEKNDKYEDFDEASRVMLENIDNYDGTSNNQKDVPDDRKDW